jgi:hypothetical protein
MQDNECECMGILSVLLPTGAEGRDEFLCFVSGDAEGEARGDVRGVCLHAAQ